MFVHYKIQTLTTATRTMCCMAVGENGGHIRLARGMLPLVNQFECVRQTDKQMDIHQTDDAYRFRQTRPA